MGSDARRKLSYAVGTQTPETPTFDPPLSEMAQRLFESQLEASLHNSTLMASTPGAGGFQISAVDPIPTIEEPPSGELPMSGATPLLAAVMESTDGDDEAPTPSAHSAAVPTPLPSLPLFDDEDTPAAKESSEDPVRALPSGVPELNLNVDCNAQSMEVTVSALPTTAMSQTAPQTEDLRKKTSNGSSGRSSSEGPRKTDRAAESPVKVFTQRSQSARLHKLTPPRVEKESPPRGCVGKMVKLWEQSTPSGKATPAQQSAGQTTVAHRHSAGALPEPVRHGPRCISVPTPTGAGAPVSARSWRTDAEKEDAVSETRIPSKRANPLLA